MSLLAIGMGIYALYLSFAKKEKLGNKTNLARWSGILLILGGTLNMLSSIFGNVR